MKFLAILTLLKKTDLHETKNLTGLLLDLLIVLQIILQWFY